MTYEIFGFRLSKWARISKWARSNGYWPRYKTIASTMLTLQLRWRHAGEPALPEIEDTDPIDRAWAWSSFFALSYQAVFE